MEYDETCFEIFDDGNFLRIIPIKLAYEDAEIDWDKNWIKTQIEVNIDSFKGNFHADLRVSDFTYIKTGIEYLYTNLSGTLLFEDIESYLEINIKGDGIGHFEAKCSISDNPGYQANELSFYLNFDQTQLMPLVRQLNKILNQYKPE